MSVLQGIIKRVTRCKGIVGRVWLKSGATRAVDRMASWPVDGRVAPSRQPAYQGCGRVKSI